MLLLQVNIVACQSDDIYIGCYLSQLSTLEALQLTHHVGLFAHSVGVPVPKQIQTEALKMQDRKSDRQDTDGLKLKVVDNDEHVIYTTVLSWRFNAYSNCDVVFVRECTHVL